MSEGALLATMGYTAAAALCLTLFAASLRRPRPAAFAQTYRSLYLILGILLLLMAVSRATALFYHITDLFRADARMGGWYQTRRDLQRPVLRAAIVASVGLLALLLFVIRRQMGRHILLVAAIAFLCAYAAVQLISLHATDAILRQPIGPLRVTGWLDLIGVLLSVAAALTPPLLTIRAAQRRKAA